ncbi:MAG: hypothetical protein U0R26_10590 [Solirubrobacterales bacterium]
MLWDRNIWIAIVLMNWTAGAFLLGQEAASSATVLTTVSFPTKET